MMHLVPQPDPIELVEPGYWFDEFGILHQKDLTVREKYDLEYVRSRYGTIPEKVREMSLLRSGYLIGAVRAGPFKSVLDVGYGNGDFLRVMHDNFGATCFGLDVSGYPLPAGCEKVEWSEVCCQHFQLVTWFDSLEHVPNLAVLDLLDTDFLAVTAPCFWPGFKPELAIDWFRAWKHRRPGEHLHHLSPHSLENLMESKGYRLITCDPVEDAIRGPAPDGSWNTFTAVFERV